MREDLAPLLTSFTSGSLTLDNRFVMSPMTRKFSPNGIPGDDVAAYYTRRAMAKVGLIITEGVGVDHPSAIGHGSMGEENIPVMHGDAALAGWRAVVERVHAAGGKIIPQLWHMGGIRQEGTPPFPDAKSMRPNDMSEVDIADIIAAFVRSAANAKAVGFDGIALHGGHGYLIDSFLWAGTNARDDTWGGDIEGRTRFAVELVKAIRAAVGPEFPILFRISQWKLQDYEAKLAETLKELQAAREEERKAAERTQEMLLAEQRAKAEHMEQWARESRGLVAVVAEKSAEQAEAMASIAASMAAKGTVEIGERERAMAKREDDLCRQSQIEKLMVAQQEAAAARMKAIEEQMIAAAQLMMVQQEAAVERMKAAEATVTSAARIATDRPGMPRTAGDQRRKDCH